MRPAWPMMKPIRKKSTTENIDKQHGTMTPKNVLSVLCVDGASPRLPLLFKSWSIRSSVSESDIVGPTDVSRSKTCYYSSTFKNAALKRNIYLRTFTQTKNTKYWCRTAFDPFPKAARTRIMCRLKTNWYESWSSKSDSDQFSIACQWKFISISWNTANQEEMNTSWALERHFSGYIISKLRIQTKIT